jgi:hypothetical protein
LAIEVWELKRDERRCGSQEDVEDGKTWKARRFGRWEVVWRREVVEDEKMWTTTREKMWEKGEEEKKKMVWETLFI